MEETLLTVNQAAKLKGVSRAAVYAAIADDRLAHLRVLGHIGLRQADVLAWKPLGIRSGRPKGMPMSDETKARLSESQKRRWAERKAAKQRQSSRQRPAS